MQTTCPRCGKPTLFASGPFCSQCGASIASDEMPTFTVSTSTQSDRIEWETDALNNAPFSTLAATFTEILFHPDRFFKKISSYESPTTASWIFALIAGSIGLVSSWVWSMLFVRYGASFEFLEPLFDEKTTTPFMLISAPILLSLQLLVSVVYIKFVFRLSRLKRASYSAVFRVVCYAEAPMVLQVIPVIGTFVGSILWFYAIVTGLHHLYEGSRLRVFMQLLLPIIIVAMLLGMIVAAGVVGGFVAGAGAITDVWSIIERLRE